MQTMRVEPNQARTYFPPVRQRAAGELSWEQPAAPPGFARLERVHNAAPPVLAPRPQILAPAATAVTAGQRMAARIAAQDPLYALPGDQGTMGWLHGAPGL